jgi:hypothetical protein
VIRRAHHLSDDRLLDCYQNGRDGTTLDPRLAEHLADCPACGKQYAEIARFMDTLRSEAERESDAIFTAERLRQQQQQIARRIEHSSRSGRIISFPGRASRRILAVSSEHRASRWIAASAAAGLFVGVALGASYRWDVSPRAPIVRESATARPAPLAPAVPRINASQNADDVFMSELEMALDRPRTRELIAIDALTPHFREIRAAY